MAMSKYKIVSDNGKQYILVSDVPTYAREVFNTIFGIPSYRTLRYYVSHGVLNRPERLGRETFFELNYIMEFIANYRGKGSKKIYRGCK